MTIALNLERETVTRRKFTAMVSSATIIEAINRAQPGDAVIPPDARVYFSVPGGGDWSNEDIDIDERHPVHIEWEEVERG